MSFSCGSWERVWKIAHTSLHRKRHFREIASTALHRLWQNKATSALHRLGQHRNIVDGSLHWLWQHWDVGNVRRRHRRPVLATDGVETTPAASAAGEIGTSAAAAVLAMAGSVTALAACVSAGAASPRSTLPRGQRTIQCTCKSCLAQGDRRC